MSTTTRQILGANGQTLSIVVIPNATGTTGDAQLIGLTDGTNIQAVTAAGAAKVDGSGVTQPISAATLPLPAGAAQDSTLTGGTLKAIVRNLAAALDVVTVVAQNGALTNTQATPFGAATIDTPTFSVGQNNKRLIYVVVGVAINWATSGQVTVQPYVATSTQTASTGASGLAPLIDTAQNLGAVGTTLAVKAYVFDSATLPSLAQPHLYMGFRFVFPSTPTNAAGASLITVLNGTNT